MRGDSVPSCRKHWEPPCYPSRPSKTSPAPPQVAKCPFPRAEAKSDWQTYPSSADGQFTGERIIKKKKGHQLQEQLDQGSTSEMVPAEVVQWGSQEVSENTKKGSEKKIQVLVTLTVKNKPLFTSTEKCRALGWLVPMLSNRSAWSLIQKGQLCSANHHLRNSALLSWRNSSGFKSKRFQMRFFFPTW